MDRCTRFKQKILSLTQQMVEDQRHSVKSEVSCGICCAGVVGLAGCVVQIWLSRLTALAFWSWFRKLLRGVRFSRTEVLTESD
jgi:hypothetical protein